jgi:hypothetical protein
MTIGACRRPRWRSTLGPWVGVVVVLGGCVSPTPPRRTFEIPAQLEPAEVVIGRVDGNADRMPAQARFSSHLSVEAGFVNEDGSLESFNGDGLLQFAKPTYLYMYLNHGLVRKMLEIGSDGERYWLSFQKRKTIWWGKYKHLDKPLIRDMPIRPDQLIDALGLRRLPEGSPRLLGPVFRVGTQPIPHTLDPQYTLAYSLREPEGWYRFEREYSVSRVPPYLTERIVFGDKEGKIGSEAALGGLAPADSKGDVLKGPPPIVPRRIWLRLIDERNYLSLELRDPQVLAFTPRLHPPAQWPRLEIPPGWEVIQIDKDYDRTPTTSSKTSPLPQPT